MTKLHASLFFNKGIFVYQYYIIRSWTKNGKTKRDCVAKCTASELDATLNKVAERCFMCTVTIEFMPPGLEEFDGWEVTNE